MSVGCFVVAAGFVGFAVGCVNIGCFVVAADFVGFSVASGVLDVDGHRFAVALVSFFVDAVLEVAVALLLLLCSIYRRCSICHCQTWR